MGISNPDVLNLWRRTLKKPSYLFWVLFHTHPMRPLGFWEWSLNTQLHHEILSRLVFCKLSFTSLQLPFRDSLSSISFSKFVLISVRSLHICQSKKGFYSRFCQTPLLQFELYASTSLWWTVEGPLKLVELPIVTSFFFFFQINFCYIRLNSHIRLLCSSLTSELTNRRPSLIATWSSLLIL